jgi:hypothetical protein
LTSKAASNKKEHAMNDYTESIIWKGAQRIFYYEQQLKGKPADFCEWHSLHDTVIDYYLRRARKALESMDELKHSLPYSAYHAGRVLYSSVNSREMVKNVPWPFLGGAEKVLYIELAMDERFRRSV